MSIDIEKRHLSKIVYAFSKQAIPFAELDIHTDAMDMLVKMSGVHNGDTIPDVACGPGLVACGFARHASHVTGIDVTEAMIEKARGLQKQKNLESVEWVRRNANPLPFEDCILTGHNPLQLPPFP